jgi:type II secretory pathway component PulM
LPAALECRKQLRRVVFWLVGILLFFIVLQSYVILLTDVLRGVEQHNTALNSLEQQLKEIKTVKPDIEEDNPNLTDIEGKRANLDAKVIASFDMLIRLSCHGDGCIQIRRNKNIR